MKGKNYTISASSESLISNRLQLTPWKWSRGFVLGPGVGSIKVFNFVKIYQAVDSVSSFTNK
jgi:hypothetical protein